MSDRIAVMNAGKVLQIGEPQEIYERPANRFVADFIGETNFMEGQVQGWDSGDAAVLVDGELLIHVPSDQHVSKERQVVIAVRPERISIQPEASGPHAVAGMIEEVIYTGTDTRYLVRLTKRTVVTVRQQNTGVSAPVNLPAGLSVYLHWQPESSRLLMG
jgi:spermidine/putrescine transport system ATP-binding protein